MLPSFQKKERMFHEESKNEREKERERDIDK